MRSRVTLGFSASGGILIVHVNTKRLLAGFLIATTLFVSAAPAVVAQTSLADIANDTEGAVAAAAIACFAGKMKGVQSLFGGSGDGGSKVPVGDASVQASTGAIEEKQNCTNVIARAAAQTILRELTIATVNWINHGFNGNPLYVKDTGSILKNIADQEIRNFNSIIAFNSKNYPFGRAAAQSLTAQLQTTFAQRAAYSLDAVIAQRYPGMNSRDYMRDFAVGGWDAFLAQTMPNNNPFGFNLIAKNELASRVAGTDYSAAQDLKDTIQRSMGFMNIKTCSDSSYRPADAKNIVAQDQANLEKLLAQDDADGVTTRERYAEEERLRAKIKNNGCGGVWQTTTPGSVIAHQINTTLDIPSNQLINGQDLAASLTAIFDALTNQLLQKGLSYLSEDGNAGSIDPTIGAASGYGLDDDTNFNDRHTWSAGANFNLFSDIPSLITNEYNPTDASGSVLPAGKGRDEFNDPSKPRGYQQVLAVENAVVPRLIDSAYELDYCVPGPRPTWESDTQRELATQLQKWPRNVDMQGGDLGKVGKFLSGTVHDFIAGVTADKRSEKLYGGLVSFALTQDGPGVGVEANAKVNGYANAVNIMNTLFNRYADALSEVYGGDTSNQGSLDYRGLIERSIDQTEFGNIPRYQKAVENNKILMDDSVATESQLRALVERIRKLPTLDGYPGFDPATAVKGIDGPARNYKADLEKAKNTKFALLNAYELELRRISDTFKLISPNIHGPEDVRNEEAALSTLETTFDTIGGTGGYVEQCIATMQSSNYTGPEDRVAFPPELTQYLTRSTGHKLLTIFPPTGSFLPDWHYAQGSGVVLSGGGTADPDKLIQNDDVVTINSQGSVNALSGFEQFLGAW